MASSKPSNDPQPGESALFRIARKFFYRFLRLTTRNVMPLLFSMRVEGRYLLPESGGAMLLSTHQSMMDPVLVGLTCNRTINYLARHTLFKNPVFSFLIRILDAIEIDRERGGLSGLREMLKRLNRGEAVLLFPEGTRTQNGQIGTLKPGFIPIARRTSVPLVPIAIVGAYECMPKGSKGIFANPICLVVGKPFLSEEYSQWSDDQLLEQLDRRLHELHDRGRSLLPD
jgi:1-acyl-sn-glycerol-3-phosphate acyltransferase